MLPPIFLTAFIGFSDFQKGDAEFDGYLESWLASAVGASTNGVCRIIQVAQSGHNAAGGLRYPASHFSGTITVLTPSCHYCDNVLP